MKVPEKKLLFKITVWLVAEILLNASGLDNLADYSEFIFERRMGRRDSFAAVSSDNYFYRETTNLKFFNFAHG